MDQNFQVGELVIMQNATFFEEHNGAPAVIIAALELRSPMNLFTMKNEDLWVYRVRILIENTPVVAARPHQLRTLLDDEQNLTSVKLSLFNGNDALIGKRILSSTEDRPYTTIRNPIPTT